MSPLAHFQKTLVEVHLALYFGLSNFNSLTPYGCMRSQNLEPPSSAPSLQHLMLPPAHQGTLCQPVHLFPWRIQKGCGVAESPEIRTYLWVLGSFLPSSRHPILWLLCPCNFPVTSSTGRKEGTCTQTCRRAMPRTMRC